MAGFFTQNLESQVLIAALALLLASVWLIRRSKEPRYDPPVPPGSLGFPLVGETLHLLREMKVNKPEEFFETRVRKYGPTFKTHLYGSPTVVVNPPAGVKFIFANHNRLVESTWPSAMKSLVGEQSLLFMQGAKAKSFRHILSAFLGPESVQRYVGRMSRIIQKHLEEKWRPGSEVKAYELVKQALFKVVFDLFFSLEEQEEDELFGLFTTTLRALLELPIDFPGTSFRKAKVARGKIFAKLDSYLTQRRLELEQGKASPAQDLLSVLITTKDEDGRAMSDDEIKQNMLMLVIAGHDTSASSLAVSLKFIAENPWCYDELLKEHSSIAAAKQPGELLNINDLRQMKYTWRTVQESMRLIPAGTGSLRVALTDFQLDGYTVPKGWQLLWTIYRNNKNTDFFEEPDKFDPDRFSGTGPIPYFTPFGGGPRMCPGYEFARMQDCVFLHHLVLKYKWTLVDPDEIIQVAPMPAPLKGLPVKLVANRY